MATHSALKANMYDARVYHMDLCILAYHLYHQSLIWPMDPYYEAMGSERDAMMAKVTPYLTTKQLGKGLRGPGGLNQGTTNSDLDPIITKYDRVNPWISSFIRPETQWEFLTPSPFITQKIKTVFFCEKGKISSTTVDNPALNSGGSTKGITDYVYCFEGGTGIIRKEHNSSNPAWSMMGFVLARDRGLGDYDIHIAFRGSRSGSAGRALKDALISGKGNADWVTDMDFKRLLNNQSMFGGAGEVSEGFSLSMQATIDNIYSCLTAIYQRKEKAPRDIYVTGHSLGGALAVMCANALSNLPSRFANLSAFPFKSLRLLSYSAPTVGDRDFANYFNSKISASRFLIDGDPVTSGKNEDYGVHAGARVILPQIEDQSLAGFDAHEPKHVRAQLVAMIKKEGVVLPEESNPIVEKYENLEKLITAQYDSTTTDQMEKPLLNYQANLELYLKVFAKVKGTVAEGASEQFIKFMNSTEPDTSKIKTILKTLGQGDKMEAFFTLCYALFHIYKGGIPTVILSYLEGEDLNTSDVSS